MTSHLWVAWLPKCADRCRIRGAWKALGVLRRGMGRVGDREQSSSFAEGFWRLNGSKKCRCSGFTRAQTICSGHWKCSSCSWCKSSMTGAFPGFSMVSWRIGSFRSYTRAGGSKGLSPSPTPGFHTAIVASRLAWMLFGVPMPCNMFIGYLYVSVYPEGAPNQILDPLKAPVPAGP